MHRRQLVKEPAEAERYNGVMDYHDFCKLIDRALPGEGVWFQAVPNDDGSASDGLAIRREPAWYLVVYFRVVPSLEPETSGAAGEGISGDDLNDWKVEIGYAGDFDSLAEAKREARGLVRHLPRPPFLKHEGAQDLVFAALDDLEDPDL